MFIDILFYTTYLPRKMVQRIHKDKHIDLVQYIDHHSNMACCKQLDEIDGVRFRLCWKVHFKIILDSDGKTRT